MGEIEHLQQAIAALEVQRPFLGDAVVEEAVKPLREKLRSLLAGRESEPDAPPALQEQRKLVTILFADLSGFTAMAELMDPEEVRDVLDAHFKGSAACIERFHGEVEKYIGDAVMAVFGLSLATEDDPENAIRAALAMQEELQALNPVLAEKYGLRLSMRVGITTGPVVVSLLGDRKGQDFVVVGDTANLASRLQTAAPPGGILISHETYRHVRGVFTVQVLNPIAVKGKREPVQVYLVQAAKPRAFRSERRGVEGIETRMVGREAELRLMQETFYEVESKRQCRMLTVTGDAGVGKSRLLYEFDNWVELLPETVFYFRSRAYISSQNVPYGLLRSLFSFRFNIQDSDPPDQVWQKLETGIRSANLALNGEKAEMDVEAVRLIGHLLGLDTGEQQAHGDARELHDRALVHLGEYFCHLASVDPVVVLCEDIHWADDSSLDAIQRVAETLIDKPVLIVLTARPSLFERNQPWEGRGALHTRLDLHPLSEEDSRRLVDEILQKADTVPETFNQQVSTAAEGNPFFLEEIIKMLIEDGVIQKEISGTGEERWHIAEDRLSGVSVPSTLVEVLQARFDGLPASERVLLQRAAVIGRTFWDQALETIGSRASEADGIDSGSMNATLGSLTGREMIYPQEQTAFENCREYLFKHMLLRDVTYESVLKRRRRLYHAYIAAWLEEATKRSGRADEYAAQIAEHYSQAGSTIQAAGWFKRAGQFAAARYANKEAAYLFTRALDLWSKEDLLARFDLLLERERAYHLQGEQQAQADDLEALTCLLEEMVNEDRRPDLQVEVLLRHADSYFDTGDFTASIEMAQQASELARSTGQIHNEGRARKSWGAALKRRGIYDEAHEKVRQALELARQSGDQTLIAESLRLLGSITSSKGEQQLARQLIEEALQLHQQLRDLRGEAEDANSLGIVSFRQGDYSAAKAAFDRYVQLQHKFGDRYSESMGLNNIGVVTWRLHDYPVARACFDQCLQISRKIGDREHEANSLNGLGSIASHLGDFAAARDYLEASLLLSRELGDRSTECSVLQNLSLLFIHMEEYAGALETSREAFLAAREMGSPYEEAEALRNQAIALSKLGRLVESEGAAVQSLELRRKLEITDQTAESLSVLAEVRMLQGEIASARAIIEEILILLEKDGASSDLLESLDDPSLVYLVCCRVLKATNDPKFPDILSLALTWIYRIAGQAGSGEGRTIFLENIPSHRDLLALERQFAHASSSDSS